MFEPGDRVAIASPGYPPYRHILTRARLRAGADRDRRGDALGHHRRHAARGACASTPLAGVLVASPANPTGTMMTPQALARADRRRGGRGIRFISDEIYHGLDYAMPAETAVRLSENARRHQLVLEILLHDRLADRLDGGARAAGAADRPPAGQPRDLGADAVADRGGGRVRRPRRDGGGQARLRGQPPHPDRRPAARPASTNSCRSTARSISTPTCRASPTTASISPSGCCRRREWRPRRASTSIRSTAGSYLRFCYAGSAADMREAVERIGDWLRQR